MQITNCGRGVHKREIKGIDRFRKDLPPQWYAFTNLDLVLGPGRAREIDLIIVSPKRIFLVDIKDWFGRIESKDGRWLQNGVERDSSPVTKVTGIAREIRIVLEQTLKRRPETKSEPTPSVEGLVVLTGQANTSGIEGNERAKVLTADEFVKLVTNEKRERETFGNIAPQIVGRPLTDSFWKDVLSRFFGAAANSPFRPGRRRFQRYVAEDAATFSHPSDIYREYDAVEEGNQNDLGTLRLWDFTKCSDGRFQSEEGRLEIAGREHDVYHWLRDRTEEVERALLTPKLEDPERGVHYWEIYDRRRRMQRLRDFASSEAKLLSPPEKIELARQMVSVVAAMHRQNAAHLDLGGHSIWLEAPTSIKLSHLFAARFPEVRTLGASRFQFLSSVRLPEDILGVDQGAKRRDVFLLGVAVHQLLFGCVPGGDPSEWNPDIDSRRQFTALHDWFGEILELDPTLRFEDAQAALEAFNKATATHPTPDEVIVGLERFRGAIRSQRQLATSYPCVGEPILESDRVDVWESTAEGTRLVVKLWKQAAWGDIRREGSSVLSFLQRASDIRADRPQGLPRIRDILWLGDSMVLAQHWEEGPTLRNALEEGHSDLLTPAHALGIIRRLIGIVDSLHGQGLTHGDIKPENIVIGKDREPVFIDALDYSPASDGDRVTGMYAPPSGGGALERDRYAITRVVEEILSEVELPTEAGLAIANALRACREKEPVLSTLMPLVEAIEKATEALTAPVVARQLPSLQVSAVGATPGPLDVDEGALFVSLRRDRDRGTPTLLIRGATEVLEFRLDQNGKPLSARRRGLDQRQISGLSRSEFLRLPSGLTVVRSDLNDFSGIEAILAEAAVKERLREFAAVAPIGVLDVEVVEEASASEDVAEDILAEEIVSSAPSSQAVDVPLLWRNLIDVENELRTEGIVTEDSFFDRQAGRHRVLMDLESGVFDFARQDTVGVERQDSKGSWRRIGTLDVQLSRPEMAVVDASETGFSNRTRVFEVGDRIRFVSHFELQSLRRRTDAVDRILAGAGRSADLLAAFDPRTNVRPQSSDHQVDEVAVAGYDLNLDQRKAFSRLLITRPIGLLQGPPGTGKTRFIAALAHYAIAKGLARNVLLASQSHEAVNTAAEAVVSLFRKTGVQPSLLRVAMDESLVSPSLKPYHSARVEQSYKDRFSAQFAERMAIVGRTLGLPEDVVRRLIILETEVRSICVRLASIERSDTSGQRIDGLKETLRRHLESAGVQDVALDGEDVDWNTFLDDSIELVLAAESSRVGVTEDRIHRFRNAAGVARDFIGSVSRAQRSFDTFLAGTRQIVAGTCVGLGRTSLGLTNTAFDLVIVDEAARCTASELLVPLQAARWAVLVGDQAQLEPQHRAEVINLVAARTKIQKREIQRSDFERIFSTPYGGEASASLKTQYRMLPPIGQLVSETFYASLRLDAGRSTPEIDSALLPEDLGRSLLWIDTDELGSAAHERKHDTSSRINKVESDAVVALLERWHGHEPFRNWLLTQSKHPTGIGVICMYAAQRMLIERRLRQSPLGYLLDRYIKVGTVDSYQGKENPIVILSLVRNNDQGQMERGSRRIQEGFLAVPNRVNVAASRAMDRLIIVGAKNRWRENSPIGCLSKGFDRQVVAGHAAILPVTQLLEREQKTTRKLVEAASGGARES